jgi:1-acyl-sn-glycerol-3-phosphate acyltransferase
VAVDPRLAGAVAAEGRAGLLNTVAYWSMWWTLGTLVRLFFRLRVENRPSLRGAYVLVANHTSLLDPLLLGAASHRRITFLMTELHFRSPLLGWFYRFNRAVPLALRGGNRDGLRAARATLRRGEVVGVFPEGGISRDGLPLLGSPGAVSLVLAEDVPVVPVNIEGAQRAFPLGAALPRPASVRIRYGDPIGHAELAPENSSDRKARLAFATRRIMDGIAATGGRESREAWLSRGRA